MSLTFPVFDITAYLPDSLAPHYVSLRDTVLSWLNGFGIGSVKSDASEGSRIGTLYANNLC